MSFGKKGVVPGAQTAPVAARPGLRPAASASTPARPATPVDPYAAQREAFLAAERERRIENGEEEPEYSSEVPYPSRERPASRGSSGYVLGAPEDRNLILAYVFWYFCAPIGLHRIYCGSKETGLYQLGLFFGGLVLLLIFAPLGIIALGAWLIWIIADLFLMPGMMRRFKAEHRTDYRGVFA